MCIAQIKHSRSKSNAKNIYDHGTVCENFLEVVCGPVPPRLVCFHRTCKQVCRFQHFWRCTHQSAATNHFVVLSFTLSAVDSRAFSVVAAAEIHPSTCFELSTPLENCSRFQVVLLLALQCQPDNLDQPQQTVH